MNHIVRNTDTWTESCPNYQPLEFGMTRVHPRVPSTRETRITVASANCNKCLQRTRGTLLAGGQTEAPAQRTHGQNILLCALDAFDVDL